MDGYEYENDVEFLRDAMRHHPRAGEVLAPLLDALEGGGHASTGGSFALRAALDDLEERLRLASFVR